MRESRSQLKKLLKDIGNNIRQIRLAKKLTQEQLDGNGFNLRWLQYIEAGERNVNVSTRLKVAKALKVPFSDLFKGI